MQHRVQGRPLQGSITLKAPKQNFAQSFKEGRSRGGWRGGVGPRDPPPGLPPQYLCTAPLPMHRPTTHALPHSLCTAPLPTHHPTPQALTRSTSCALPHSLCTGPVTARAEGAATATDPNTRPEPGRATDSSQALQETGRSVIAPGGPGAHP